MSTETRKPFDPSRYTKHVSKKSRGVITFTFTTSGTRLKLGKELLADIGNPKYVEVLIESDNICICASESEDYEVCKDRTIYDKELATDVAKIAGVEIKTSGSAKAGSYRIEEFDGKNYAVVEFDKSLQSV